MLHRIWYSVGDNGAANACVEKKKKKQKQYTDVFFILMKGVPCIAYFAMSMCCVCVCALLVRLHFISMHFIFTVYIYNLPGDEISHATTFTQFFVALLLSLFVRFSLALLFSLSISFIPILIRQQDVIYSTEYLNRFLVSFSFFCLFSFFFHF